MDAELISRTWRVGHTIVNEVHAELPCLIPLKNEVIEAVNLECSRIASIRLLTGGISRCQTDSTDRTACDSIADLDILENLPQIW